MPKRKTDTKYGEKIIHLFASLMFNHNPKTYNELVKMLGCSKSGLMRMLDDIQRSYGIKVHREQRQDRQMEVWIDRKRDLSKLDLLSETELRILQMCKEFTKHMLGDDLFKSATLGLDKTFAQLDVDHNVSDNLFAASISGTIDYSKFDNQLKTILEAMETKKVIEVHYQNPTTDEPKTFRIKPLKIFNYKNTIYVHAQYAKMPGRVYRSAGFYPTFALQRFKKVTLTDTPFRNPNNYDFEKHLNQGFGVFSQKKFKVKMELTGWAQAFVRERLWSKDQKFTQKSNSTVLEFTSTSEEEVVSLVLSFKSNAKLITPKYLVKRLRDEVEVIGGMYL
jgi:predicted DNA-binding transcriptional regulator YafY